MASSPRPPRWRPPPPSPSHSLFGLEKSVPPSAPSPGHSSLSPWGTPSLGISSSRNPSLGTSPLAAPLNKPLPNNPSPTSSVYSGDSGYTRIVSSYADRDDSPPPMPTILQPKAYRDTVAALLNECLSEAQTPDSIPILSRGRDQSIPFLRLTPDVSAPVYAVDSKPAPSFAEFSRHIRERRNEPVSPLSSKFSQEFRSMSINRFSSPLSRPSRDTSPLYRPISAGLEEQYLPSPELYYSSEKFQLELMPPPLDLSRSSRTIEALKTKPLRRDQDALQQTEPTDLISSGPYDSCRHDTKRSGKTKDKQKVYRLSTDSFSDDSFIVYNGAREVVRAMVKDKISKRKATKAEKKSSKEVKRVLSETRVFEAKDLSINRKGSASTPSVPKREGLERKFSWVGSRRSSVQQGVSNLLRSLSVRNVKPDADRGRTMVRGSRRRQKQRAIPTTPYQIYGADIWLAKNRRKREKARAARKVAAEVVAEAIANERNGEATEISNTAKGAQKVQNHHSRTGDLAAALYSGRRQILHGVFPILHAFDGMKGRSASQRRRQKIKKSIVLVGPTVIGEENAEGGWL